MSKSSDYHYLIGRTREDLILVLGQEYNYYHSEIWYYTIKISWFGRKTILSVYFDEDLVENISIDKTYG